MNIKNMKKRARQKKKVFVNDPGRSEFVFGCLSDGVCPDCGGEIQITERPDYEPLVEFDARCPSCDWQCSVGGSSLWVPK